MDGWIDRYISLGGYGNLDVLRGISLIYRTRWNCEFDFFKG